MDAVKKSFMFSLVSCIAMLIPVLTLIWNAAKLSAKVDDHDKRISDITQTYNKDINDVKNTLATINISLAELRIQLKIGEGVK